MSVIVSSMPVIIPAILRALDVGDPFMQEDTVDPGFTTTIEIARMTLTRVELGLPVVHIVRNTGNGDREGVHGPASPKKQRDSVGLDEKEDQKHRLTTQFSDGSLGTSVTTKIASHDGECEVPGLQASEAGSVPAIEKQWDPEEDAEGKRPEHPTT